jgi:hypothetical protein
LTSAFVALVEASIVVSQDVPEGDEADGGTYREFADHQEVKMIVRSLARLKRRSSETLVFRLESFTKL